MFPGQLPSVRKDTNNVIHPLDLTNSRDTIESVEMLESFVKRLVPVRFGIVPIVQNDHGIREAKILYHLVESHGLSAALQYLKTVRCLPKLLFINLTLHKVNIAKSGCVAR